MKAGIFFTTIICSSIVFSLRSTEARSCPSKSDSIKIAITSSCQEEVNCPSPDSYFRLVCASNFRHAVNPINTYCGFYDKSRVCSKDSSHSKNDFDQCYSGSTLMTCLRRTDEDKKQMFERPLYQKIDVFTSRSNYFNLADVKENHLLCGNEGNYSLENVCHGDVSYKACQWKNGATWSLEDICSDYSFWSGPGRCINLTQDQNCPYHPAILCDKTHGSERCGRSSQINDCSTDQGDFYCSKSNTCIPGYQTCDGILQCQHGEDEDFELCRNTFPDIATIECLENRTAGYDVTILAVPCDGIQECKDGSDEDCKVNNNLLFISLVMILLVTIIIWCWIKYKVLKESTDSKEFRQRERIDLYTSLRGDDLANLKEATNQIECAENLKSDNYFSKMKEHLEKFLFDSYLGYLMYPLSIVASQLDFIKDILLLSFLNKLCGGFSFRRLHLFSVNIVLLLTLTIFGPQFLAAIRLASNLPSDIHRTKMIGITTLLVVAAPLLMYYHKMEFLYLDQKCKLNPDDDLNMKKWEKKKRIMSSHVKLELGLETIYQLAGQFILLGLAYTQTATNESFATLFKKETIWWLVMSSALSFVSCVISHLTAISACREHIPLTSKIVASLYCFIGCTTRVLAIVIFFAVPLGLFNLLRHLQGEQYPWHPELVSNFVGSNGKISIGNEIIAWSLIDRRENFWTPPDYTLFTYFKLGQYFALFLTHLFLHAVIIFIAKYKLSMFFRDKLNFIEKVIHCIENTNIPYNAQEWDDGKGNAEQHHLRMTANSKEVRLVIGIKTIMNTILLIPLAYLVFKIQERQTFLWTTIGYLDQEHEALITGYVLFGASLIWIICGGLAEAYFFSLYNGKFHPFANILLTPEEMPLNDL